MARNLFGTDSKNDVSVRKVTRMKVEEDPFARYDLFSSMYDSNNLYQDIRRAAYENGEWLENIFSIANASHRSVEFYSNRLMLNARITTKDKALETAINQFWRDSNFMGSKDNFARELAKNGDLFVKLKSDESKVFMERIDAKHVTEVSCDSRGVVTEIRIDIPQPENKTYTEFWTIDNGGHVATWLHTFGKECELDRLGTPTFYSTLAAFGIGFIPLVWIKFTSGDKRAENCFVHAISKMMEGDREHSRLAEIMYAFNTAIWSLTSTGLTEKGQIVGKTEVKFIKSDDGQVIQHIKNGGELKPNIPQLDYSSHIALIKLTKEELREDLPEIRLNSLDMSQASGRAIEQMLGESINRARTARFNLSIGIQRINMMAVHLGIFYGFFDKSLGNYIDGDFRHSITCDSVIPLSSTDKSVIVQQMTSGGMPLKSALRFAEFSTEEIEIIMLDKAEEEASLANSFLSNPAFSRDTNKQEVRQ